MIIIKNIPLLRKHLCKVRQQGRSIALVPTMGNLHSGHIKLIDEAKIRADFVVVSIFINPMQFDNIDDLIRYPHTFNKDCDKLNKHQVDLVFSPTSKDIYPKGMEEITYVEVPSIASILEGVNRPGHFRGVATIIIKLFNLIQPNMAFFGEKDFQQLALIRKIVIDLNYDIEIVSVPIIRAKDDMALSSRNSYLDAEQRKIGPGISKIIKKMAEQLKAKELIIEEIIILGKQELKNIGFRPDYLQILDADTLLDLTKNSQRAVILVAAWLGQVRLIDNVVVNLTQ